VGFVATFQPEGAPGDDPAIVIPFARCQSRQVHSGTWRCSERGVFTLKWDNSYSRIRNKPITFDIKKG